MFGQTCHVEEHILSVHEGKKAFKCDFCDISYTTKSILKKLISIIHEGRKKEINSFKCDFENEKANFPVLVIKYSSFNWQNKYFDPIVDLTIRDKIICVQFLVKCLFLTKAIWSDGNLIYYGIVGRPDVINNKKTVELLNIFLSGDKVDM